MGIYVELDRSDNGRGFFNGRGGFYNRIVRMFSDYRQASAARDRYSDVTVLLPRSEYVHMIDDQESETIQTVPGLKQQSE